jgi:serine/threonine protein phosphatase PrpC
MHSGRISGTLSSSRAFGDYDFKQHRALPQWQQQVIAVPSTRVLERTAADQFLLIGCDGSPDIIMLADRPDMLQLSSPATLCHR